MKAGAKIFEEIPGEPWPDFIRLPFKGDVVLYRSNHPPPNWAG